MVVPPAPFLQRRYSAADIDRSFYATSRDEVIKHVFPHDAANDSVVAMQDGLFLRVKDQITSDGFLVVVKRQSITAVLEFAESIPAVIEREFLLLDHDRPFDQAVRVRDLPSFQNLAQRLPEQRVSLPFSALQSVQTDLRRAAVHPRFRVIFAGLRIADGPVQRMSVSGRSGPFVYFKDNSKKAGEE